MSNKAARLEIAKADFLFSVSQTTNSARAAASAVDQLGTEMKLALLSLGCVKDDEGHFLPEMLEAADATNHARAMLEMVVRHGRTF